MCLCIYIYRYIYIYIHMHGMDMHIGMYIYIYIHILYTYMYIHVYGLPSTGISGFRMVKFSQGFLRRNTNVKRCRVQTNSKGSKPIAGRRARRNGTYKKLV